MRPELNNLIEQSRRKILAAIGDARDITYVRSFGNIGDRLMYAGTRRLLAEKQYREVSILQLEGVTGELALVASGGAWCHAHSHMTQNFPRVERQFERVIVLPSSYDISMPAVSEVLRSSQALFFARERISYEQIRDLCRAELVHDCAFFFDYSPYMRAGEGALYAYRTDEEAVPRAPHPLSQDISMTCEDLDEFLWLIARHEVVHTDRAHIMIAAANLGKRVYFLPSNYHKVPALAEWFEGTGKVQPEVSPTTEELASHLMEEGKASLTRLPAGFFEAHREAEITIVMLSYHRLDQTRRAIESLRNHVALPFRLLLIDNNSGPEVREKLTELRAAHDFIELLLLDENLGCAGGRTYAMRHVKTPYVLFLDNDVEVFPGTIEHLLLTLETHPEAYGATGRVIFPDGTIHIFGGGFAEENGLLIPVLNGFHQRYDDPFEDAGACQWLPGALKLVRTRVMLDHPYDPEMRSYWEDVDWGYRLSRIGEGKFYRVQSSAIIHYHQPKESLASLPPDERRRAAMRFLETLAYFYRRHGLILHNLWDFVPELGSPHSPLSRASAGILLDLCNHRGVAEMLTKWDAGELQPLFHHVPIIEELEREIASLHGQLSEKQREMAAMGETIGALNRQFDDLYRTRYWKLLDSYWRWRKKILGSSN